LAITKWQTGTFNPQGDGWLPPTSGKTRAAADDPGDMRVVSCWLFSKPHWLRSKFLGSSLGSRPLFSTTQLVKPCKTMLKHVKPYLFAAHLPISQGKLVSFSGSPLAPQDLLRLSKGRSVGRLLGQAGDRAQGPIERAGRRRVIHLMSECSIVNHPAIGLPPFMETSMYEDVSLLEDVRKPVMDSI